MNEEELRKKIKREASKLAKDFEERNCPEREIKRLRNTDPRYLSRPKNIHKMISEVPEQFKEDLKEFKKKVKSWVDEYKASQQEGFQ